MSTYLTDERADQIDFSSTILSGISLSFSLFLLCTALWVYIHPIARRELDRVSFRLMLWSMVFSVGFDLTYILQYPALNAVPESGSGCTVLMYWQIATISGVNYFITCIALNLMFTICFAFNPIQMRMERWYILGSLILAFGVPIVPAALGHFGQDPVYNACYFTAPDLHNRLVNFILDLYLWQISSTLVAIGAITATLITLFRNGRATAKALLFQGSGDTETATSGFSLSQESDDDTYCKSSSQLKRLFRRRSNDTQTYQLQDRFMSIAIRISLYPLILIILNVVLTVGDLYLSAKDSIDEWQEYGLYIVYYTLYGGRNIFLASIGIFVDPCLWRGVKVAWQTRKRSHAHETHPGDMVDSDEMDFSTALASFSHVQTPIVTPDTSQAARYPETHRGSDTFTSSFPGVKSFSLPSGMTDDVDVDLQTSPRLMVTFPHQADIPEVEEVKGEREKDMGAQEVDQLPHVAQRTSPRRNGREAGRNGRSRRKKEERQEAERVFSSLVHQL